MTNSKTNVVYIQFYLILNVAVGGTGGFFPDGVASNPPKPWQDTSPTAMREFWDAVSTIDRIKCFQMWHENK